MKWGWALLLLGQCAFAQSNNGDDRDEKNADSDISGNPYLFRDWSRGTVRYPSGRVVDQFKIKFDCSQNKLQLQFQGSAFAAESKVQAFTLYPNDKKRGDSMVFRKGFPATEKANNETFYQVLLEGRAVLLKLFLKNILEEKQLGTSETRRRYIDAVEYYLFKDGRMILLPEGREEALAAINDKTIELRQYITEKQLRLRSTDDFVLLAGRYNELLQ